MYRANDPFHDDVGFLAKEGKRERKSGKRKDNPRCPTLKMEQNKRMEDSGYLPRGSSLGPERKAPASGGQEWGRLEDAPKDQGMVLIVLLSLGHPGDAETVDRLKASRIPGQGQLAVCVSCAWRKLLSLNRGRILFAFLLLSAPFLPLYWPKAPLFLYKRCIFSFSSHFQVITCICCISGHLVWSRQRMGVVGLWACS